MPRDSRWSGKQTKDTKVVPRHCQSEVCKPDCPEQTVEHQGREHPEQTDSVRQQELCKATITAKLGRRKYLAVTKQTGSPRHARDDPRA